MSSNSGHVLVVEDNPNLVRILQRILQISGFACECAENEHRALEKISESTLVVVADINLSETGGSPRGGIVLAESLREKAPRPIILISQTPWHHFSGERLSGADGWMERHGVRAVLDRTDDDFVQKLCAGLKNILGS